MALTPEEELAQLQSALAAPPPATGVDPAPAPAPAPMPATGAPVAPTAAPAPAVAPALAPPPQGVPTYAPPPPPPPMPGAAALPGQVADFATNWMQTPNRYLSELATSTRTAGDARLRQGQTEGLRGIEEWAASRGLTGSSYEGDQVVNLTDKQGMARAEQERSLLEMMAGAETQDRQAAGQYGINAATLGDTVGLDRYKALMDAYGIESGVGLEAASLAQDKEQFTASLGQNATQFDKQMSEQQAGRMQQYGISTGFPLPS